MDAGAPIVSLGPEPFLPVTYALVSVSSNSKRGMVPDTSWNSLPVSIFSDRWMVMRDQNLSKKSPHLGELHC